MWAVNTVSVSATWDMSAGPTWVGSAFSGREVANPLSITAEKAGRYNIVVELDDNLRLHSGSGKPSVERNGDHFWHWHGVEVPELVILYPEQITVQMIDATDNAEVRRVMIEKYGQTRYLEDCGAELLKVDAFGELYEKSFAKLDSWPSTIRFVRVKNSTPEPDGTFKFYTLRVPPETRTPKQGIAWTFGLESKQYAPAKET